MQEKIGDISRLIVEQGISSVWSIFPTLFGRWQQQCSLLRSVMQQLRVIRIIINCCLVTAAVSQTHIFQDILLFFYFLE